MMDKFASKVTDYTTENIQTLLKAGLISLASALFLNYIWKRPGSRNPPGPLGYPLLGSMMSMRSGDQVKTLKKLRKEYGDIIGMQIGERFVIYLNGREVIRDAFVKHPEHFSERADMVLFTEFLHSKGKHSSINIRC